MEEEEDVIDPHPQLQLRVFPFFFNKIDLQRFESSGV